MDRQIILQYKDSFDSIATYIEGENRKEKVEVWFARELQRVLGYARWENFQSAISRAVESCKTQGINVDDHFRELTKMILQTVIIIKEGNIPFMGVLCSGITDNICWFWRRRHLNCQPLHEILFDES